MFLITQGQCVTVLHCQNKKSAVQMNRELLWFYIFYSFLKEQCLLPASFVLRICSYSSRIFSSWSFSSRSHRQLTCFSVNEGWSFLEAPEKHKIRSAVKRLNRSHLRRSDKSQRQKCPFPPEIGARPGANLQLCFLSSLTSASQQGHAALMWVLLSLPPPPMSLSQCNWSQLQLGDPLPSAL